MAKGAPATKLNSGWGLPASDGSHPHLRRGEDAGPIQGPRGKRDRVKGCLKLSINDAGLELLTSSLGIYQKNNLKF